MARSVATLKSQSGAGIVRGVVAAAIAAWMCQSGPGLAQDGPFPTVRQMIESRTDAWGDLAMRESNGASYEFFENLLPPVRWVNTEFRHYPIVLSAPRSPQKSRLVSNGSAINARAKTPPMWYESGTPVSFSVGKQSETYGNSLEHLATPTYLQGFLPIVTIRYTHGELTYAQETFAPVDERLAASGVAMVRFSIPDAAVKANDSMNGSVAAKIESDGPLREMQGSVVNAKGECIVAFSGAWKWMPETDTLVAKLDASSTAELAVFTKPAKTNLRVSSNTYDEHRKQCIDAWNEILDHSIGLQTPESIVNDAWRAMLIGNFMIAVGDRPHYSAQNAYAKLYEGECGDTLRSFLLYGHLDLARAMLGPMLKFNRADTRFHVAGHKLQLLAYYYWVTRDAKTVRESEPLWRPALELILASREKESGLLPKDRYAGDIAEKVYSLNSNANCWRGIRDVAAMLANMGHSGEARRLQTIAKDYHAKIVSAVERSERLETKPPFIPNALLADEPAHDPLTATRTGSYYDLMCPYIIGSEIFGQDSEREGWLLGYMQNHGGIAMGMPRVQPAQGIYKGEPGVNPLYGLRYQLALLRRDEREKALVGFYGQLAQGMTRGTFIGGEGSRFVHGDANGRSFYLPPNSTSNAAWLIALRHLLVQDWDLDGDAKPETLRLMFGVPRRWLEDGKTIVLDKAPTAFGPVSCRVDAKLDDGYVEMKVTPPKRHVEKFLVRAPVPEGWRVNGAEIAGERIAVEGNTIKLPEIRKAFVARFSVVRRAPDSH
jgi:hypothetical protein